MSNSYSPALPLGKRGEIKTNYPPAKTALASHMEENASTSSVIALTHDTTELEVAAENATVAGRWATNQATSVVTAEGSANYDFLVPSGEVRRLVVPIETQGGTYGSIQGVNREEGLFQNVAFKTTEGNGSVLAIEF